MRRHDLTIERVWTALVALCILAPGAFAANLVGNGSLESAPLPGDTPMTLGVGSTALAPWSVTAGNVEAVGNVVWVAAQGNCSVALNGSTAGTIAQSFATFPGTAYSVSFWLTGDPHTATPIKHLQVRAAGQSKDFQIDTTPAWEWSMGWTPETWTFTANAATTTLEFASLDANSDTGPAIDSVQVAPTGPLDAGTSALSLALARAIPNPASAAARIAWNLPAPGHVRLVAYDVRGREAFVLEDGTFDAGAHGSSWDVSGIAPGVYVMRLEALGQVRTQRMAVVR